MKYSAILIGMLLIAPAFAATKTYQVTGPVTEVTEDAITVQKGKEKWEIARDPSTTKIKGDAKEIKKGDNVTVEYRMSATSIEVKGGKKAAAKGADKSKAADKGAGAPAR